jgi:hypothetical protein
MFPLGHIWLARSPIPPYSVVPAWFARPPCTKGRSSRRFELRLPADLCDEIDEWRRNQLDLPNRAEGARRLIELGLYSANKGEPNQLL